MEARCGQPRYNDGFLSQSPTAMQICTPNEIIIQGITHKGRTFRPSDWAERLSGILSSFNTGRLSYHEYVRPLLLNQVRCVAVDKQLEALQPAMFRFLMDFANDNDLRILDCESALAFEEPGGADPVPQSPEPAAASPDQEKATATVDTAVAAPTVKELLESDTAAAFAAMQVLRPHLESRKAFVEHINTVQRAEGYRLAAAFLEEHPEEAAAVAGFRTLTTLAWGKIVYIDDLSTLPAARGRGAATALLEWILAEAQRLGCAQVHLDSGVQAEREDAHRLYFNRHFRISSYHFSRNT